MSEKTALIRKIRTSIHARNDALDVGWALQALWVNKLVASEELEALVLRWIRSCESLVETHAIRREMRLVMDALSGNISPADAAQLWRETWESPRFASAEIRAFVSHAYATAAAPIRYPHDVDRYTVTVLTDCVSMFLSAVEDKTEILRRLDDELSILEGT